MASNSSEDEVVTDLSPIIRVYRDGRVERLFGSPYVQPSLKDAATGVSSKDISISPDISARLYLPQINNHHQKVPILVYYHGGGFCLVSAFSSLNHQYINLVSSLARAIVVSVEYRLAPEHSMQVVYEDCWTALQWVASHAAVEAAKNNKDPWLTEFGNFDKVYVGGDSAGGNIAHHMAMRTGFESLNGGNVKILGAILSHPYFLGSEPTTPTGSNFLVKYDPQSMLHRIWLLVHPSAKDGFDDPMINPLAKNAPRLSGLGCSRLFVCVAEKDELRDRGIAYVEAVKKSGWQGEVMLVEVEGEDHCFHIANLDTEKAMDLINCFACFIN